MGVALFAEGKVGKAFTGIITTFLKEDKMEKGSLQLILLVALS